MINFLETSQYWRGQAYNAQTAGSAAESSRGGGMPAAVSSAALAGYFADSSNGTVPAVMPDQQGGSSQEYENQSRGQQASSSQTGGIRGRSRFDSYECQTCKEREYKDGSDDPGVSFKTPAKLSPEQAATAVRSHEYEHVNREQAKADREGREVVSQNVSYRTGVCPECGRVYVAGGTTRTVTKKELDQTYGLSRDEKGRNLELTA